jgi:hypothetical protein
MFRLIFRMISLVMFLLFLVIGLALWKGGEPFRWVGEGLVQIGRDVTKFGDVVDEIIDGGKKIGRNYDKIKEIIDSEK